MFIQKFASGCRTSNGKYNLFTVWYRSVLSVEITEKEVLITSFGFTLWKAPLSCILTVKIQSEVLGAKVNIITNDGKGFLFMVNDTANLVSHLKMFNLPVQFDKNALKSEVKRYKFASNPIVLIVSIILSTVFIIFLIYGIMLGSR